VQDFDGPTLREPFPELVEARLGDSGVEGGGEHLPGQLGLRSEPDADRYAGGSAPVRVGRP
jgi:hypothetical protein